MSEKQVCKAVVMSVISADCVVTENKTEFELILKENDELMHAIRPKAESLGDMLRVFGIEPKYGCRLALLQGRTCWATVDEDGKIVRLHRHGDENIAWESR
ncbi:MAG: hypothetical protein IJN28_05300 [Selenomonadales bacterium]|nr:hypothetical protein [Selenomonadales bacterium]